MEAACGMSQCDDTGMYYYIHYTIPTHDIYTA